MNTKKHYDAIIIGAGAAGLMCAIEAAKRYQKVLVIEKEKKPGKKILMAGGGRCNFTNYTISADNYISHNPHFCKSALSRYTQWDFIKLVEQYNIPYHEKTLGQLFCNNKSKDILNMLLAECAKHQATIALSTSVKTIQHQNEQFIVTTDILGQLTTSALIIATGGLSIPTMGSSPFAYHIAEQFGLKVWPTRAGLVPFTLHPHALAQYSPLAGISIDSLVSNQPPQNNKMHFRENILFTHRGLSGPAILQISSYWQPGEEININLLPDLNLFELLKTQQKNTPKKTIKNLLAQLLPKQVIPILLSQYQTLLDKTLADCAYQLFQQLATQLHSWSIKPNNTEGYRTAEVTLGGVDCDALSSKTMMVKKIPGLYFIGEAVDVTGWLGGYNFQWAWSSGVAAGRYC